MGHDIHFLSRLERVSLPHVELALSLYRDPPLLLTIFERARVPEGIPRVAISLDDPAEGPFLLVERSGHFVTCLGRGMTIGDLPVVTRAQLDAVSQRVGELRARMELAKDLSGGQTNRLIERIATAAEDLTREEFVGISAFQPLLHRDFLHILTRLPIELDRLRAVLGRSVERPRRIDEPLLRQYWNLFWAMAHLSLLVAMDDGRERLEDIAAQIGLDGPADPRTALAWMGVRQGISSLALRSAWGAARLGKSALPAFKRSYADARSPTQAVTYGMSLLAIGARHARLRAEIRKALDGTFPQATPTMLNVMTPIAALIAATFDGTVGTGGVSEELEEVATGLQRRVGGRAFQQFAAGLASAKSLSYENPEDVPEPLARAALAYFNVDILNSADALGTTLLVTPWLARARAEDFYFTADVAKALYAPWTPDHTLTVMRARREYYGPQKPIKAEAQPGRNDPCNCGSGKKYKRCCGA